MKVFLICAVEYGSDKSHVAIEHLTLVCVTEELIIYLFTYIWCWALNPGASNHKIYPPALFILRSGLAKLVRLALNFDPPTSDSRVAGITGVHHSNWLNFYFYLILVSVASCGW